MQFSVNGNGGVRVSVDGKQIVNDWVQRAAPAGRGMFGGADLPERTAAATFEKGKTYKVVVEFFRDAAQATAQTNAAAAANAAAATAAAAFGGGDGKARCRWPAPLSWNYGFDQESAIGAARKADVVIAVVGITSQLEGEQGNTRGQLPEGFEGGDRTPQSAGGREN